MIDPEVARIVRVDHAGERGAIQIYRAQKWVSSVFYPDLVENLDDMLAHEVEHHQQFEQWLQAKGVRTCYALPLWSVGGFLLGLITALMGRKAIGACTDAVETTVLDHLDGQLAYLAVHDQSAHAVVSGIKADEESHRSWGADLGHDSVLKRPIHWVVSGSVKTAIWLSTKL